MSRLPKMLTIKPVPGCTECGSCCVKIGVEMSVTQDDGTTKRYPIGDDGISVCENLIPGDGLSVCRIYETRPQICRDFEYKSLPCRAKIAETYKAVEPLRLGVVV